MPVDDLSPDNECRERAVALEKATLELFVTFARRFDQRSVLGFAARVLQQRVTQEVGVAEEALIYALLQQAQGRGSISQDAIAFGQLVTQFSITERVFFEFAVNRFQRCARFAVTAGHREFENLPKLSHHSVGIEIVRSIKVKRGASPVFQVIVSEATIEQGVSVVTHG